MRKYGKECDGSQKVSARLNVLDKMIMEHQITKYVKERYGSHKVSALLNVLYIMIIECQWKTYAKKRYGSDTWLQQCYGVATISRLLKIIGLFCKRAL